MSAPTPVETFRQAIAWQLRSMGVQDPTDMSETMLLRDGFYCGRKFLCEEFQVVWFAEEDEVKFFNPAGELVKSANAHQCLQEFQQKSDSDRRAA